MEVEDLISRTIATLFITGIILGLMTFSVWAIVTMARLGGYC